MFSKQKQAATFQTIQGTAAVFKSVSGWEDKKFYILTNEIPATAAIVDANAKVPSPNIDP